MTWSSCWQEDDCIFEKFSIFPNFFLFLGKDKKLKEIKFLKSSKSNCKVNSTVQNKGSHKIK